MINDLSITLNNDLFIDIIIAFFVIIALIGIAIVLIEWSRVKKSEKAIKITENEIENIKKKMAEKKKKRDLMNPALTPTKKPGFLSRIRESTLPSQKDDSYGENKIDEKIARLEKNKSLKELKRRLRIIDEKEKQLDTRAKL